MGFSGYPTPERRLQAANAGCILRDTLGMHICGRKEKKRELGREMSVFKGNSIRIKVKNGPSGLPSNARQNDWLFIPPLQSPDVGLSGKSVTKGKAAFYSRGTLNGLTAAGCHLTTIP